MKYLFFLMFGLTFFGGAYTYLTAEVPGGERRYEQFMRLMSERHSVQGN
jgi:hypothetical protein